ncbi:MAG TPA: hypothetical protein VLR26_06580 [Frankiaceae bacterium]|nr:hypothetical protein [Frankiaceae bacterium]
MGLLPPPPPDDEDRSRSLAEGSRGTDRPPVTESEILRISVPDDLRDLEDEVRAIQAELGIDPALVDPLTGRRARFAAWLRRRAGRNRPASPASPGLGRSLLVGPVVAMTLLVIAGFVALLPSTGTAPTRAAPAPAPLAAPTQPPGTVGGLLPDVGLESATGVVPARSLRPAVVMLVPSGCNCPTLVHDLVGQVEEYPGISSALVGSGDPGVAELAVQRDGGNGRLPALVDRTGALARTYHGGPPGSVPTVLVVAADGTLTAPPLAFTADTRLEADLLPLGQLRA